MRLNSKGGGRLSISACSTYLDCPKRFDFSYVERPPRAESATPEHWRFGSVIHAGLEGALNAFKERELSGPVSQVQAEALEATRAAWVQYDMPPHGGELDRALGMMIECIAMMVEHHENILGVEHRFMSTTPGGTPFIGFADVIRRWDDETVEVRDYKVTSKMQSEEQLRSNMQGNLYGHFAREMFPWAKKVRFSHLYPNHRKLVIVEVDDDYMAEVLDRFDGVAELILADDEAKPRPGEHCGNCAYTDLCPAFAEVRESADLKAMVDF